MINPFPHELQFSDVYITPILPVFFLAFVMSLVTVAVLNKSRLAKWFLAPQYVFLSILIAYMLLIDQFFIRF